MADDIPGGLPIAAAPVVAGVYPPGESDSDRVDCFLLGAVLGQETMLLYEALTKMGLDVSTRTVRRGYGEFVDAVASAERKWSVVEHRRKLADLAARSTECGASPEGRFLSAWAKADRAVRRVTDISVDRESVGQAAEEVLALVNVQREAATRRGIDPPLLRNIRSYAGIDLTKPRIREEPRGR